MVTAGILPFRQNSHARTGNRTRDLMINSQRLWPLDHEAGQFSKYGCKERNAVSNSYFCSCEHSKRYCKWPHRGDARPMWPLFIGKRKAFLRSAYILRYSVIKLIFVQHPAIDLLYRVLIGQCPASKQWVSFFIFAPWILWFISVTHQQMHIYLFNYLKFTLKHFRSYDHHQGEYTVPCWS